MKEYPVTFAIQEAPVNAFEPDGEVEYRVVIRCKAKDTAYLVSKRYPDVDTALAAVSGVLLRTTEVIEDMQDSLTTHRHWLSSLNLTVDEVKKDIKRDLREHTLTYKHKS